MCIFSVMSTTTSEKSVFVQFGSRTKVVKFSNEEALVSEVKKSFNLDRNVHMIFQVSYSLA